MKVFDMHIHSHGLEPNPTQLLERLDAANVYGCTVISNHPLEFNPKTGSDFAARMENVKKWVAGNEERLVPALWIHPDEENIGEKIQIAAQAGVEMFKVICGNFYVGEQKSMDMLEKIAQVKKPVLFHTGILWDGMASSMYNRPANWEAVLEIDGLRFALAHCSWPWIDECIAVYGKFLSANRMGRNVEMFIDISRGTPEIYRKELFYKLFRIGYPVADNLMYGTDCYADDYQTEGAKQFIAADQVIMDELEIPKEIQQKLFWDNFMRFVGRKP